MRINDKVSWKDLVSGRTRHGVLLDSAIVTLESQELKDIYDEPRFTRVNKKYWDVRELGTDKKFMLEEDILQVECVN